MIKYVNPCKILITLLSCQSSKLASILEYNITNHPNLPSDNFEEDISSKVSNNGKEKIRLADININKEDIRPVDIDQERPITPN